MGAGGFGWVKLHDPEVKHSYPSSRTEVKKEYSHTTAPLYAFCLGQDINL
jgi:hypothetical protein